LSSAAACARAAYAREVASSVVSSACAIDDDLSVALVPIWSPPRAGQRMREFLLGLTGTA
jgi:hypothetical protein